MYSETTAYFCYTKTLMDYNPHSLHQILTRIREQMRCPQCGTRVAVDFPSIKLAGEDFVLLQLKCESCNAFIVLHVNLTDGKSSAVPHNESDGKRNISSTLHLDEQEMNTLRSALQTSGGSFEKLFQKVQSDVAGGELPGGPLMLG